MNRLAQRWRHRHDDDGFTLVEMLVSLGITAVVMLVVTGSVLLASATSARVEATGSAQTQVHQAFDRLDRQVRWAVGFTTPGEVGTASYVEWLYTAEGTATCFQLRLDRGRQQLQQSSWTAGNPTTRTTWQVVASGVSAPTPFTLTPGGAAFPLARLRITLTATAGGAKHTDTATTDTTYTALNSAGAGTTAAVCTEGRPRA